MKTYSIGSTLLATILVLASPVAAHRLAAQSTTINIVPNVTRITDATTGQLVGPGYTAAIFWGPAGESNPDAFLQLGANMNVVNGLLAGGSRSVAGPIPGSVGVFAAAWESQHGSTYNAAAQVPGAKVGRSSIVEAIPGGPGVRIPDFQVAPVPEPSTWTFIGLGLLAIGIRHKLKRSVYALPRWGGVKTSLSRIYLGPIFHIAKWT
jgi:PEP-CTERM motif